MAAKCGTSPMNSSPFLSNPTDDYFSHLGGFSEYDDVLNAELGLIRPDTLDLCQFDQFDTEPLSSIYRDIQKLQQESYSDNGFNDFPFNMDCLDDQDTKPEIINNNCMWSSGTGAVLGTSASSVSSDVTAMAVPLAAVTTSTQNISNNSKVKVEPQSPPTVVVANKLTQQIGTLIKAEIKEEPIDDYEQQLQQHSIPTHARIVGQEQLQPQTMKHIPPGASLLRKSNALVQFKKSQKVGGAMHLPKLNTSEFLRERESSTGSSKSSNSMRPDTPRSLDDDNVPEFKHNVDLRACIMGSNNISLSGDPDKYINHVSQELQDLSKDSFDSKFTTKSSLAEVLDVISGSSHMKPSQRMSLAGRSSDCDSYDDDESLEGSTCDTDSSYAHDSSQASSHGSIIPLSQPYLLQSDHSYSRSKDGIDDSLPTPSDSEEEIDVVSIGDKKLPTNPSDKDRQVLQTKVAYKISERVVKTANGVRTIPPRRRCFEMPYTPASSSPVKSVATSRYPSPASTPYQNQYTSKYGQPQIMTVMAGDGTTINVISDRARKRAMMAPLNGAIVNSGVEYPPTKKYRGKKVKSNGVSSTLKRHYSLDEPATADTLEKRNLHNDMERQRRIGLKNLFEALKKQIPSIKDKERAPKVNILREAAKLCESLTREDQLLNDQKAVLKDMLRQKQEMLARLRATTQLD